MVKLEFSVSDVGIRFTRRGSFTSLKDNGLRINRVRIVPSGRSLRLVLMEKSRTTARRRRKLGPAKLPILKKEYPMEIASKSKWVIWMPNYFDLEMWYLNSRGKKANELVLEGKGEILYVEGGIQRISKVHETISVYSIAFLRSSSFCAEDSFPALVNGLNYLLSLR
ncbi:hypothetical protein APY94_02680 [Thermococcus celericrescens]|uniref:Uncharacterized protein n=1 Tax=Thermococcus celericrescens TaxID=227598 RepID=A0A117ITY3_9EURY|nr:hypothetical protein [Thermococcus celericrescens]KUH34200.1 hypothetical protein APY94_02680 [Thermococcus celericrescens]